MRDDSRTGWTDGDMLSLHPTPPAICVAHPIDPRQFDPPVTEAFWDPETLTLSLLHRQPRPSSPGLHGPKGVNGSHPAEAPPEALKNVGFKTIVVDQAQKACYLFRLIYGTNAWMCRAAVLYNGLGWIATFTDWRDTHGSSSLRSKARQSSLLVCRRCRGDPSRRDSVCRI